MSSEIRQVQEVVNSLASIISENSRLRSALSSAASAIKKLQSGISTEAYYKQHNTSFISYHDFANEALKKIQEELTK